MSLPYITVLLPLGTSLLVQLEDTDGQFVISYGDPNATPEGMSVEAVRVMSDLPDSSGRNGIVYEELFGSQPEETVESATEEPISEPTPEPVLHVKVNPFGSGLTLEQMLAGAIAKDPETGTIPTEPAPEAVELAQGSARGQGTTAAPSPVDGVENGSTGGPEPVAVVQPLPPGAKPMEDNAPRDGTAVILFYDDMAGRQEQPARWSPHFGRQFWVDEEDNTLGLDEGYIGWRLMTSEEKEEYGLN